MHDDRGSGVAARQAAHTGDGFYEGLIGAVYASAISDQHFTEDTVFERVIAGCGGTALELGSGTGRFLLRMLRAGYDVHGVEISAEMTALCRAEGQRLGLSAVVHEGSFAPLAPLQVRYAAMYCPLNSFSFITDDQVALESLRSCAANLRPGGTLAIGGSAGDPAALAAQPGWVRRQDVPMGVRTATVHERRTTGRSGAVLEIERVVRLLGEDGNVVQEERGHQTRRLRPVAELVDLFAEAGLGDMRAFGVDADYVLTGRVS